MFTKSYNAFVAKILIQTSVIQEDLEHIDCDDSEYIDIKWQAAILALRTKRFYNRPCRSSFAGPIDRTGLTSQKKYVVIVNNLDTFLESVIHPRSITLKGK